MASEDLSSLSREDLEALARSRGEAARAADAARKRERQQREAENREREEREEKLKGLFNGTFFATIDEVLKPVKDPCSFTLADYRGCCRRDHDGKGMRCRTATENGGAVQVYNPYETTYNHADSGSARIGGSRTTYNKVKRNAIWPTSVFGPKKSGEIAHLVPHAPKAAESYWFVTDFLYGCNDLDWDTRQRMLHGVANASGQAREGNTGIRHMVSNKIRVAGQRDYLDNSSCLMILPIPAGRNWNEHLEWAKHWRGQGYSAIAMIGAHEDTALRSVCSLTEFNYLFLDKDDDPEDHTASTKERRDAVNLLRHYTKAILFAQQKRKPDDVSFDGYPKAPNDDLELLPNLQRCIKAVRKITFEENDTGTGHPAPDPLLLLAKMVSVWARRLGLHLCASAEPQEDDVDDLSEVAMDHFLEWRDKPVASDLIGMTVTLPPEDGPAP